MRCPWKARRSRAAATISRSSPTLPSTALNGTKCDLVAAAMTCARVVLPLPGGPHRTIDRTRSDSMACVSSDPGREQALLAHHVGQGVGAHAVGERGASAAPAARFCAAAPKSVEPGSVAGASGARGHRRERSAKRENDYGYARA